MASSCYPTSIDMAPTIQTSQAFRTPDGVTFETEEQALAHIYQAEFRSRVNAYIDGRGLEKAKATRAYHAVIDFLTWEAMNEATDPGQPL